MDPLLAKIMVEQEIAKMTPKQKEAALVLYMGAMLLTSPAAYDQGLTEIKAHV